LLCEAARSLYEPGSADAMATRTRLKVCMLDAPARPGDAEEAARGLRARELDRCPTCKKHAGNPACQGFPMLCEMLRRQPERPAVLLHAEPVDDAKLRKVAVNHYADQCARSVGGWPWL